MLKLSAVRIVLFLSAAFISTISFAQTITTPRTPSPAAEVKQNIGLSTITVNYSRPSIKGREVWGKLVPYGWNLEPFGTSNPAPWRAGANENTVLTLSNDATIRGKKITAGSYGLFFVINKDNTGEVVLSKDYKSWGNYFYDPKRDEMRAGIQLRDISNTETLTYEFIDITKNSTELVLNWEKKQFPLKIEFDVDGIVMANAADELKGALGFDWHGYSSAANYALQNKVNYDQALEWIDKAIAQNKNFVTLNTKTELLKATGKTEDAEKLMREAITVANENELNAYSYQLLNEGKQDKAIEMLLLNTQRNPKSANAWDSLGEGYSLKGDKKNAIASFKKSLTLNPAPQVKANSEKYLKQLGAL
ncbi:hypothetical protein BH10BAC2_BH10BAC2_41750 [soil metagenome]